MNSLTLAAQRRREATQHSGDDDLRPARGLLFSAMLGCGLWMVILYCTWLIVR